MKCMQMISFIFVIIISVTFLHGDAWVTKTSQPVARGAGASAVVNNRIYVIGGWGSGIQSRHDCYDPVTNTWSNKASLPTATYYLEACAVHGKIYAIGGWNGSYSQQNIMYDPATNSWATKADMPTARGEFAIGVINNKIYCVGGYAGVSAFNVNEEYDPATNAWTTKAVLPTARHSLDGEVVDNKLYAIGGFNTLTANEMYDPATDSWTTKVSIPYGRHDFAIGVINGKIYVLAGSIGNPQNTALGHEYDPINNTWKTILSLPTARREPFSGAVRNKIYVIGGQSSGWTTVNEMYACYTPEFLSPDGGETWPVGALRTIAVTGPDSVDYYLSLDGGYSYQLLAQNAPDSFTLRVPHTPTRFALIKAAAPGSDPDDPANYDISDSLFTIESTITLLMFTAETNNHGVVLQWNTSPGIPDICGYNLYRAENNSQQYDKINSTMITDNTYLDEYLTSGSITYRLTAVNGWHQEYTVGFLNVNATNIALAMLPSMLISSGTVMFDVPRLTSFDNETEVELIIYDMLGNRVATLLQQELTPGLHTYHFNGQDDQGNTLASGSYILIMKTPEYSKQTKFIKLR